MDANNRKPEPHAPAVEPDTVSASVVIALALVLAGAAVVASLLIYVLFQGNTKGAEKKERAAIAAAGLAHEPNVIPPAPRLQIQPVRHWKDFRQAELDRLATYGWMDRSAGTVHIPIERAMDLVLERGVGPLPPGPLVLQNAEPAAPAEDKK